MVKVRPIWGRCAAMTSFLRILPLEKDDIPVVTVWARQEGFAPGLGDLAIYRHTDRQGIWVGWLGNERIGCITGVRYNAAYGFIGLYLVCPPWRGRGYGLELWRHALEHLGDLACVGVEAAPDRSDDYAIWGFQPAAATVRLQLINDGESSCGLDTGGAWQLLEGAAIPQRAVQRFDAEREPSPRPHFLAQWLNHPAGSVLALVDSQGRCHGFGRIRPLMAETPEAAERLLHGLLCRHRGVVLVDAPSANPLAQVVLEQLGFRQISQTLRMYRGTAPAVSLQDVYGLACLELG